MLLQAKKFKLLWIIFRRYLDSICIFLETKFISTRGAIVLLLILVRRAMSRKRKALMNHVHW